MQTPLLVTCFPELQTNLKRSSERKSLSIPSLSNNSSLVVIRFSRSCFFSNWSGYSPYRSWYSCITKQSDVSKWLRTKWLWVRVQLQSLQLSKFTKNSPALNYRKLIYAISMFSAISFLLPCKNSNQAQVQKITQNLYL